MGARGRRKYKCSDCGEDTWFRVSERKRAARIKCGACGSIWLDPVSEEGKLDLKNEGSNLTHVSRNPDGSKGH